MTDGPASCLRDDKKGVEFGHAAWGSVGGVIRLSSGDETKDAAIDILSENDNTAVEDAVQIELGSQWGTGPIQIKRRVKGVIELEQRRIELKDGRKVRFEGGAGFYGVGIFFHCAGYQVWFNRSFDATSSLERIVS